MKTLYRIITKTLNDKTAAEPATQGNDGLCNDGLCNDGFCNYANNYYGDQVCTLRQ